MMVPPWLAFHVRRYIAERLLITAVNLSVNIVYFLYKHAMYTVLCMNYYYYHYIHVYKNFLYIYVT